MTDLREELCRILRSQYRCFCNDVGGGAQPLGLDVTIEKIWSDYEKNYATSKEDVCPAIKQIIRVRSLVRKETVDAKQTMEQK